MISLQDNNPWHTSIICQDVFSAVNVTLMECPTKSPDANPIENVQKFSNVGANEKIKEMSMIRDMNGRKIPFS